ncbi:Hypothetical predicted protein [Podarcis lilfordi]|uniref:Uncharacterized protein n=1 Tax=Podarcis lilfordi TaxID=74358 RepID=A0AA35NWF8_9SAUR|nr:Hypothetical predicted protein [Podarcis lilfordi]
MQLFIGWAKKDTTAKPDVKGQCRPQSGSTITVSPPIIGARGWCRSVISFVVLLLRLGWSAVCKKEERPGEIARLCNGRMAPKGRKRKAEATRAKTATSEGVEMNVAEESPKKPKKDEELGFRVIIEHCKS